MIYPGYIILADGKLLDCGDGGDNTIVYGPDDDQACVERAVSVLGLPGVEEVMIKKVEVDIQLTSTPYKVEEQK